MNYTKSVYEGINNELKEELPLLYDRCDRIFILLPFYLLGFADFLTQCVDVFLL